MHCYFSKTQDDRYTGDGPSHEDLSTKLRQDREYRRWQAETQVAFDNMMSAAADALDGAEDDGGDDSAIFF